MDDSPILFEPSVTSLLSIIWRREWGSKTRYNAHSTTAAPTTTTRFAEAAFLHSKLGIGERAQVKELRLGRPGTGIVTGSAPVASNSAPKLYVLPFSNPPLLCRINRRDSRLQHQINPPVRVVVGRRSGIHSSAASPVRYSLERLGRSYGAESSALRIVTGP